jgi:ATP-dependent Lhr-like helicase
VGWGRLSPHPATLDDSADGKRRVIPTSVAPITLFVREDADWMTPHHPGTDLPEEARGLSQGAREVLGSTFYDTVELPSLPTSCVLPAN